MRWKIVLAFLAVYLCWGMTYLAMRIAVRDIPPHLMSGTRFLVAGPLLGVTSIAKAGTYAYVNPIVAVFLGWAILDEPVTGKTLIAALVILLGVALVNIEWKTS